MTFYFISSVYRLEKILSVPEEHKLKKEVPSIYANQMPLKGMDLSSSPKFSFPLQNSFGKTNMLEEKDGHSQSDAQMNINQRMMMMINQEKAANADMADDEDNDRYREEDDENGEGSENTEKGTLPKNSRKNVFDDTEIPTEALSTNTR